MSSKDLPTRRTSSSSSSSRCLVQYSPRVYTVEQTRRVTVFPNGTKRYTEIQKSANGTTRKVKTFFADGRVKEIIHCFLIDGFENDW